MSTQRGLSGAHMHRDSISLADLRLLRKEHPNAKNYQFHGSIKHQHIKTWLGGMCSILSALRPRRYHQAHTAHAQMTPRDLAVLRYSYRGCCCPHAARTPLLFFLC